MLRNYKKIFKINKNKLKNKLKNSLFISKILNKHIQLNLKMNSFNYIHQNHNTIQIIKNHKNTLINKNYHTQINNLFLI